MKGMKTMSEATESAAPLRNGKQYSTTFLAMVAAKDWEGVEALYPNQENGFSGKWSGCPQDTEMLREMAAADGYIITKW